MHTLHAKTLAGLTTEKALLYSKLFPSIGVHARLLQATDRELFIEALATEPPERVQHRIYSALNPAYFGEHILNVQAQFGTKIVLMFSAQQETAENLIGFGDIGFPENKKPNIAMYIREQYKRNNYGSLLTLLLLNHLQQEAIAEFDLYQNPTVGAMFKKFKTQGIPVNFVSSYTAGNWDTAHLPKYIEKSLDFY